MRKCIYLYLYLYLSLYSSYGSRIKAIKSVQSEEHLYYGREDKIQLLYATWSFMHQLASGVYTVYSSHKILFKCLRLLITVDFSFKRSLLLINLIINYFFISHNWQILELGFPRTFVAAEYLKEKLMFILSVAKIS